MNTKHYLQFFILCLCTSFFLACSSDNNPVGNANTAESIPLTANTMTISIDGSASTTLMAFGSKSVMFGDTMIIVAGIDNSGKGTGLGLLGIHTKGTYPIGTVDTVGGMPQAIDMDYMYILPGDTIKYLTPQPVIGSPSVGTLKLAELTNTTIKATFSATLTKIQGNAGAATIKIVGGVNAILPK